MADGRLTAARAVHAMMLAAICLLVAFAGLRYAAPGLQERLAFGARRCRPADLLPSRALSQVSSITQFHVQVKGARRYSTAYGWYMRSLSPNDGRQTVLFFHGNSGNMMTYTPVYTTWLKAGFNVITLDPPGFGASRGNASEANWYASAEALIRFAERHGLEVRDCILHGFSLGTAAASHAAKYLEERGGRCGLLLMDSGFENLRSAAVHMAPGLSSVSWLMKPTFNNGSRIRSLVRTPLLFVHSNLDEVTPYNDSWSMYESVRKQGRATFYPSMQPCHSSVHVSTNVAALARHLASK